MEFKIGIVLSGGGSRGLAHVGALKALVEADLAPQCVSGTSAGAIVGALYAADFSPAEMLQFFAEKNPFRFSKLALRKPGIIDSEKIVPDFQDHFPQDSFEALQRKLFVAATDIVDGRLEVFSTGSLIRPVIASACVPMVFTPTSIDGRLYADGGILNNFPIEPLLGLCDLILGVYASPMHGVEIAELKSSLAVSYRAFEIGMHAAARRKFHLADLVISPPELARYSLFDGKRHPEILELGYQATRERLDEIRALLDRGKGGISTRPA